MVQLLSYKEKLTVSSGSERSIFRRSIQQIGFIETNVSDLIDCHFTFGGLSERFGQDIVRRRFHRFDPNIIELSNKRNAGL